MLDLLQLDNQYTAEELMLRDSVTNFVNRDILPNINQHFENATFPNEIIKNIANLGLLGMNLPNEFGGANASYIAYGLVCQELERGDTGIRSFMSVQNSLCIYPIYTFGTSEQQQKYLKPMINGDLIGCFGLTESHAGSDPSSMKSTASPTKGGYILNGSKLWITNATIADLAIIWAKAPDGIRGFIVDTKSKGFCVNAIKHKMSLRASTTGELVFNEVFVPDDCVLIKAAPGLKAAFMCLNQARFGIAWGVMGAARECFDITLNYLLNREQFNKPLASKQLIQYELAKMYTNICKTNTLNISIAKLKDINQENPSMISMAKSNACRDAIEIARTCRNLLGANGISLEYNVIRHLLNLESVFTYEGTDNIHMLTIGKYLTGISAF